MFAPHRRYVVAEFVLARLSKDFGPAISKISRLAPRTRNFDASAAKRGRVLIYNGSGGYGDQLLTWALPSILHSMGYEVHVAVDPGNEPLWWTVPHCASIVSLPVEYEHWQLFDHHAVFETVSNTDEHPDQLHPLDAMLWKIGLDPATIPMSAKVQRPLFTDKEKATAEALGDGRPFGLYQLAASIPLRSLTPTQSADALATVATKRPDLLWLAIHDQYIPQEYTKEASELGLPNVATREFSTVRGMLAAAASAKLCVGPDSFIIHAAGVSGVPAIGVWGPTHPNLRTRYYANHQALYVPTRCPHAPCLHAGGNLPPFCPTKESGTCGVVSDAVAALKQMKFTR